VAVRGKVKWFSEDQGWGVLVSSDVPGDVFVHFSDIQGEGYRALAGEEEVSFEYEAAPGGAQDGCPFVAANVVRLKR
jgi:CspA family cold shock protein